MRPLLMLLSTLAIFLGACTMSQEYRERKATIIALSNKTAKNVKIIGDYKDGGSSQIEAYIDGTRYEFYVDSRLETQTQGEVYDLYPSDKGAIMLDPTSALASSIKKQYASFPY